MADRLVTAPSKRIPAEKPAKVAKKTKSPKAAAKRKAG